MSLEVEQKYPLADPAALERRLAALGPLAGETVRQVDSYFNHPGRDFAKTDEALRIRQVEGENCLTYKGPKLDRLTKTRREIEISLGPGQPTAVETAEMLVALGFVPVARVSKQRRHLTVRWQGREVLVALDDVERLGTFVELEILTDEMEADAARDCLLSLAAELELANAERRSYLELLLNAADGRATSGSA